MLKLVRELFSLLSPAQHKKFFVLQILVVLMTIGEIVGVAAIAPFMTIVGDMSILQGDGMLADIYLASGINNPQDFAFWLGLTVLVLLTLSAGISMLTVWRLSLFATRTGTEIADRLFQHYMQQNWLFHASSSSAQLTKQVANESGRVTTGVLQPLMIINARAVFAISMLFAIFVYKPQVAIVGALILVTAYLLLYKVVRKRLQKNGYAISEMASTRYRLMNDGFGGIKDTLLLGRDDDFVDRFHESGEELAYAQGSNMALSQAPRYLMELVAFGIVIALVLYLFEFYQGNLGAILPVVSVYALAGFKLLPAFQQIYVSVAQIKGNLPAFEAIKDDLKQSKTGCKENIRDIDVRNDLHLHKGIELIDVDFTYPGKETHALKGLDLSIPVNSVVGIVGSSGSGKSTAIDIILGLITPDRGSLRVDDQPVSEENVRSWQNRIGFVAQAIFLSEGTVAENVAFGIPQEQIDREQVCRALKMAHLLEMIDDLPNGIDSKVGERGIQLSGGQRQRVGIARALYHEADVLIFDEATSALDGITEKMIMDAIHDFRGKKTIIMIAHRLKTVQNCDRIHMMENGRIVDSGSYQQLLETSELFRKMAAHA